MKCITSQPVIKIIANPEACITMLMEKLQKSVFGRLLSLIFKDQSWSLWESGRDNLPCSKLIFVSLDSSVLASNLKLSGVELGVFLYYLWHFFNNGIV